MKKKKNLLAQKLFPINFNKNVLFKFSELDNRLFIFDQFFLVKIAGSELNNELENWLSNAELSYGPARGIIAVSFASVVLQFYKFLS